MLSFAYAKAFADRRRRRTSTNGCATSSARSCSRSSSRPTPRRCGACRATRSPPTGPRSASRGSISASRSSNALKQALAAGAQAEGRRAGGQDADRKLPVSAQGPRHDVGSGRAQDPEARRQGAHGPRAADSSAYDACQKALAHRGLDRRRRPTRATRRDHVISSAPVRELVEKITPTPISRLHARALRYRDFLTVALMVKKPDLFPDNWIYIHDPSRARSAACRTSARGRPKWCRPGMSCLGLEYFCFEGDGLWNAPDDELIALAKKEIAKIGLIAAERRRRRLRGAPAEGLSGLRRELSRQRRDDPAATSKGLTRRCTWSAATACTSTTTRTTP